MSDMPRCETCRWWDTVRPREVAADGYCHRYPPVLNDAGPIGADQQFFFWPPTSADDWCGEHSDHQNRNRGLVLVDPETGQAEQFWVADKDKDTV